jgi:hypothetical protein
MSEFKKKVSLFDEYEDSIFYKADCDCGDKDCEVMIEVTAIRNTSMISLNFYKTINMHYFKYYKNWFVQKFYNIINRFKYAFIILFTGEISLESEFILNGEEHIDNFVKAIEEGKTKMKAEIDA